jgi:hypothetical protein
MNESQLSQNFQKNPPTGGMAEPCQKSVDNSTVFRDGTLIGGIGTLFGDSMTFLGDSGASSSDFTIYLYGLFGSDLFISSDRAN